jgi:hypothetical protein
MYGTKIEASDERPGSGGRFVMRLADDGVIDIHVRGFWSVAERDNFFGPLAVIHAAARSRFPHVLQLVRLESLQSPSVGIQFRAAALDMKRPGDRTAVVVATILSKLQIKRLGSDNKGFAVFTSADAARAWLLAD